LLQKYYTAVPGTNIYSGVYLWDSEESMNAFLGADLRATVGRAYQAESEPQIECLRVLFPLHGGASEIGTPTIVADAPAATGR
jgi:hypothetical protein